MTHDDRIAALETECAKLRAVCAGRLRRAHAGKHETRIYDYVDVGVPALARMFIVDGEGGAHARES